MATFNFRAFRFVDKPIRPDVLSNVTVQFVTSDDFSFSYAISGASANSLGVTLNNEQGAVYAIRQNDKDLLNGYELTAERFTTSGGDTASFFVFTRELRPNVTEKIYVQISGSAVNFRNADSFKIWSDARTLTNFPTNDPLGPNTEIQLSDLQSSGSRAGRDNLTLDVDWGNQRVSTGGGNDRVTGNARDNDIDLGFGNDTAVGGAGDDTIVGSLGADSLMGGAGNDSLDGGAGRDTLMGGEGDDVLTGGARADRFVFRAEAGDDTITDFQNERDVIVLRAFDFSRDELSAAMRQSGDDVVITLSATQSVIVENITVAALTDDILI